MLFLLFLVGAGLIALAVYLGTIGNLAGSAIAGFFGVLLTVLVVVLSVVTRLYRKASANMAFVRTGWRGAHVIKDGGALVFPVVHQMVPVSLETMRLNVERRGPHALITKDNLRVDLSAEFYIKVQPNTEDILQAARSLGNKNVTPQAVSELVQEKLVSALRTVAATKELVELHAKRDEFASAVQQIVTHDLASNGLTLESVTISALDQTDPKQLQDQNVFDAQGLRKIAEITQRAKVERNLIEREAERQVAEKNVDTRKKVLDLERDQAEFEASQRMKVATVQAAREREIAEFGIAQDEAVAQRNIEKQKTVETTEVQRRLAVEQAEVAKKVALIATVREQETAEIAKQQAVEVAQRAREVAIAQKEKERAAAQAATMTAEAEREGAKQKVVTVQVTAEADREAAKKLIAAKQQVQEKQIRDQTNADIMAYTKVKDAEADKKAAELHYEAKLRLAEGDAQALTRRAQGEQAVKMVDVNVERERVAVEQARVDVERNSLANKQEFEGAALKFELEKLRIDAEREVRIRAAEAMGNMLAKSQMRIFGDPDTMTRMTQQFMRAASYGTAVEGLLATLPPEAREGLADLGGKLVAQLHTGDGNGHAAAAASAGEGAPAAADAGSDATEEAPELPPRPPTKGERS